MAVRFKARALGCRLRRPWQRPWARPILNKGIHRLLDIVAETQAKGEHVAIMCSEGNPLDCHRHHLITRSLLDPAVKITAANLKVQHIVKEGMLEAVDASSFEAQNQIPRQPRLF